MTWVPTDAHKVRLLDFVGYGARQAPVVFIGIEEFCPTASQHENIRTRCEHDSFAERFADRDAATTALFGRDAGARLLLAHAVPVWSVMACIMGAIRGTSSDEEYDMLGRVDAQGTLLMEVLPLPRPSVSKWEETYIPEWFGYATDTIYRREVLKKRIPMLRKVLAETERALIVCYGAKERRTFEQILGLDTEDWTEPSPDITRARVFKNTIAILVPFISFRSAPGRGALFDYCRGVLAKELRPSLH